ncbi:pyruvate, orthophosphate dikinase, partial [Candidatus Electrothrix communis]
MSNQQPSGFTSKAWEANKEETASIVEIPERFRVLQEVVARYQGVATKLEHLLYEICHPYRNWQVIVTELRPFVLKNFNQYRRHEQGPVCFSLFTEIFLDALSESKKNGKVVSMAMEAMLAYADKLIASLQTDSLALYREQLDSFFDRLVCLDEVDESVMMFMVQGHHPMKK